MKRNIVAVNFEMAEHLNQFIEKKLKRFEKLLPAEAEMEIRMTVDKPATNLNKQTAIRVKGKNELFAEKQCDTFEQGLDLCLEAIERQLEKQKDR